jgi:hypothetical protein
MYRRGKEGLHRPPLVQTLFFAASRRDGGAKENGGIAEQRKRRTERVLRVRTQRKDDRLLTGPLAGLVGSALRVGSQRSGFRLQLAGITIQLPRKLLQPCPVFRLEYISRQAASARCSTAFSAGLLFNL